MATWIALLRGINVGGNRLLPMAELREQLVALGCEDVRTYIQSGNAVFRSSARSAARLQEEIADAVEASHGLRVPVLALSRMDLDTALRRNPFPDAPDDRFLHLFFLLERPERPDLDGLTAVAARTEAFRLIDRVLYLHAPDGIARSKLAKQVDRRLGVAATARNLRTARKLLEMAAEPGDP